MPTTGLLPDGYQLSDAQLAQYQLQNPQRRFLEWGAMRDYVVLADDFLGDTINLDNYAVAASGTGTAFAATVARSGTISATSANVDNASVSLITPAMWFGDANPILEVRLKVSVATSINLEVGFIDVVPGSSAAGITDIDVPTFAATNCALFHMDTDQTHAGFAFGTIGDFTGQTVATTLLTSGFTVPTADTFFTVAVQLLTNSGETGKTKAALFLNGKRRATHASAAAGHVNGQAGLAAWVYLRTRAAATPVITVDYIRIRADRGATE